MNRILRFSTLTITCLTLFAVAQPLQARDYIYAVYLTGIECKKESNRPRNAPVDNPFVVAFIKDESGKTTAKTLPDGTRGNSFGNFRKGTFKPLSFEVWRGSAQNVRLDAQLFEFNEKERKTKRTLWSLAAVGSLAIAFADGPLSPAGEGLFLMSMEFRNELIDGGYDYMGDFRTTMELRRAGKLADRPQRQKRGVGYDFTSTHRGDGGEYVLYWDVRRG